ncbi:MAG: hypothetical protein K5872_15885 [Rhizobiaceae bacterium]|nr:hypothetical protein [Rhizobiaceae bacterium]MCV0407704.1 hypothetical protein [Rhizobiaceae bacterium]
MPDIAVRPSVSGEIVTSSRPFDRAASADVVDAEFITIDAAERTDAPGRPWDDPSRPAGLRSLSAQVARAERGRRAGPAFWTTGIGVAAVAFWISGGHAVMDLASIRIGATEPISVTRFESHIDTGAGGPVLFIEGELANSASSKVDLPLLAVDVSTGEGVTRYLIAEQGGSIAARGRYRFSGRLAAPPGEIGSVKVVIGGRTVVSSKGV